MGRNRHLDPEILRASKWKELEMRIDAYRYYINIALQVNVFFYVTTGAVLGFYLNGPEKPSANHHLGLLLLLPILIGVVLGGIFICAAILQRYAANIIKVIRGDLNRGGLDIKEIPDIPLLAPLLVIFGCIFFLVAGLLVVVPIMGAPSGQRDLQIHNGIAIAVLIVGIFAAIVVALRVNSNCSKRIPLSGDETASNERVKEKSAETLENAGPPAAQPSIQPDRPQLASQGLLVRCVDRLASFVTFVMLLNSLSRRRLLSRSTRKPDLSR